MDERRVAYPDPALSDGVVGLRSWKLTDLECVEEASRDPVIPSGTSVPVPYSEAEGLAFLERCRAHATNGTGLAQAITDATSDRAVGQLVLLFRHPPAGRHVAGVGYWIVESARRRGFATRAVRLLVTWVFEHTGLRRLEALTQPNNAPSRRVLEEAGFQQEGVLRSYLGIGDDAIIHSIISLRPAADDLL